MECPNVSGMETEMGITYWFLFFTAAFKSMHASNTSSLKNYNKNEIIISWWHVCFIVIVLLIGFRFEVGGDWGTYIELAESTKNSSFDSIFSNLRNDVSYQLINWLGQNLGGGIYLVNFICAIFFSWGLIKFCRILPRPWLALVIAIPYLLIVVAMGYSRQGIAIGISLLAISALMQNKNIQFVAWILFAATFHKSSAILLPIAFLSFGKKGISQLISLTLIAAIFFVVMIQESAEAIVENYILIDQQSSGAPVRLAMNALAAIIFLLYRNRFHLSKFQESFWTNISWTSFGFVVLLFILPSSIALDRIALYWIPLQLLVWSKFPDIMGESYSLNRKWVLLVCLYSAAVLFVWLYFASHSSSWIPYKFYLWELLWLK